MKLAAISMIKNEADIIVPFLSHLAALFDLVFLLDHRSSDGTSERMREACAVLNGWSYHFCDFAGRHQGKVSSAFMTKAFTEGADAVFFLDADEFVNIETKSELEKLVSRLDSSVAVGLFSWRACVPSTFDDWHFDGARPLWVAKESAPWSKVIVPRSVFSRYPTLQVDEGNHYATVQDGQPQPPRCHVGEFFHIPIRSRQQFLQKVLVGAISNLAKQNMMRAEAFHIRKFLEIISNGELSEDHLASLAGKYAEDYVLWGKLTDLEQHGFVRRQLAVPRADIPLKSTSQPELVKIIAQCLCEFEIESLNEGSGWLKLEQEGMRGT